ncbi:MAG: serine phosphatase [Cyanobacteria bacterium RYN_339]|nr:serine phosphatase [Cyanobacteria bacterium RYN_339]
MSPLGLACLAALVVWAWVLVATLGNVGLPFPGFRLGSCLTVSAFNQPSWAGMRAGLASGDAVLTIDGRPARSAPEALAAVRALPVGSRLAYGIDREGKRFDVVVASQRFGWPDFLASFAPAFGIGLTMIAIALAVLALGPPSAAAGATGWLSLGMGLFFVLLCDYDLAQRFHPLAYFGAILLFASASLALAISFPSLPAWAERRRWLLAAPYAVGTILFAVAGATFARLGPTPSAEVSATLIILLWPTLGLLGTLAALVVRLVRDRDARHRSQLQVLLFGMAAAFLPSLLALALPSLFTGQPFSWLLTSLSLAAWVLFPLSLAYAIVRHNLFDIRLVVKRTTTYAALTAFLIGGYFGVAAALRGLAAQLGGMDASTDWQNALATAIIAVAVVPVRNAVTRLVDGLFFRTRYNFREVVARVTTKSHTTLDVSEMKLQFMIAIDEALHPRYLYILTMLPEGGILATVGLQASWGDAPAPHLHVHQDDPLLTRFSWDAEVDYMPATGLTGLLSPLAALGPHYRIPLQVGDEVVGLVILGPKRSDEPYSVEDRELLAATRLPLATALKTAAMLDDRLFKDRMDQELQRAREVQEAMLPRELPATPGFAFAASSVPCFEASGDYYDFLPLPDGRLGIAVADVAGKGIAAALATAMAKSGLYIQAQTDPEVQPVLTALNKLIHNASKNAASKSFTTCIYAVLDPAEMKLTYACAGHPPPLHYSAAAGTITQFPILGGFPLGVRGHATYRAQDVRLAPGDVLLFYTDGVTEAQAPEDLPAGGDPEPGEPFETDRLAEVLVANHHRPAAAIHDAIKQAVEAFTHGAPPADDLTLVVVKAQPKPTAARTAELQE